MAESTLRRWRAELERRTLAIGRNVLPRSLKRTLKRYWDPSRQITSSEAEVLASRISTGSITQPARSRQYSIICLSIVDWDFRWQRPQQLLSRFADRGHRVFYVSARRTLSGGRSYESCSMRNGVSQIVLGLRGEIDLVQDGLPDEALQSMADAIDDLRRNEELTEVVLIVHLPAWEQLATLLRERFGWKVVYDCMDDWSAFPSLRQDVVECEERLVKGADLVSVTAERLRAKWAAAARKIALVRNGADFEAFHNEGSNDLLAGVSRPVIGYFGAIADWVDLELLGYAARARPHYSFVLLGGVFDVNVSGLAAYTNVHLLGQKPYELMPAYLRQFDVCMIPFRVDAVAAATDPVKLYEYFSQGKPVVSTDLEETRRFGDLLYRAADAEEFVRYLDVAVAEGSDGLRLRRVEAARSNTWESRFQQLDRAIRELFPTVSLIVVSYENLAWTKLCLESIARNSEYPNWEVIVVDNASGDGTPAFLDEIASMDGRIRIILNETNRGFASACNQGLAAARGDILVVMNDDVVVSPGWLTRMVSHLRRPESGLVVAVTNFAGNESRIEVPYRSLDEMEPFALDYAKKHSGGFFDIRVAALYCVGMRRDVFELVGPLDERFSVGLFEDDDYSHRTRLAGFRVLCAEDVFVHHFGQASFGKLTSDEYQVIWDRNQRLYEEKWSMVWEPHQMREE